MILFVFIHPAVGAAVVGTAHRALEQIAPPLPWGTVDVSFITQSDQLLERAHQRAHFFVRADGYPQPVPDRLVRPPAYQHAPRPQAVQQLLPLRPGRETNRKFVWEGSTVKPISFNAVTVQARVSITRRRMDWK